MGILPWDLKTLEDEQLSTPDQLRVDTDLDEVLPDAADPVRELDQNVQR